MDNLISSIQELINLATTQSAYVSQPLLGYVLHWVALDKNAKQREIPILKFALIGGLDIDFTGTQWEAEWLANDKVCHCWACDVARKCIAHIELLD